MKFNSGYRITFKGVHGKPCVIFHVFFSFHVRRLITNFSRSHNLFGLVWKIITCLRNGTCFWLHKNIQTTKYTKLPLVPFFTFLEFFSLSRVLYVQVFTIFSGEKLFQRSAHIRFLIYARFTTTVLITSLKNNGQPKCQLTANLTRSFPFRVHRFCLEPNRFLFGHSSCQVYKQFINVLGRQTVTVYSKSRMIDKLENFQDSCTPLLFRLPAGIIGGEISKKFRVSVYTWMYTNCGMTNIKYTTGSRVC